MINVSINFLIELQSRDGTHHYARLRVPHNIPRFFFVTSEGDEMEADDPLGNRRIDVVPTEESSVNSFRFSSRGTRW